METSTQNATSASSVPTPVPAVVGWPRPRARLEPERVAEGAAPTLPDPFIALRLLDPSGRTCVDPGQIDPVAASAVFGAWACQVCGETCGERLWSPVAARELLEAAEAGLLLISGGQLCSVRCSALARSVCPHFDSDDPIVVFARTDVDPHRRTPESGYQKAMFITGWELTDQ